MNNTEHIKIRKLKDILKKSSINLNNFIKKAQELKKVIVICGPTCTGKSKVSIYLAKILNTDIISIDSMQVYRGMNIGTDKYDTTRYGIKQFMVDIYNPDHSVTAVEFRESCRKLIDREFFLKNKIPLITGGSGLYIRAVLDDLEFVSGDNDNLTEEIFSNEIRNKIKQEIDETSLNNMFEKLKKTDPKYCEKISPNDERRIIRALEVYKITGKPFSYFQNKWNERESIYNCTFIGLIKDKKILHECIENRMNLMFEKGLVNEVLELIKNGYKNAYSLNQAVGYKEVIKYLEGKLTIEDCKKEIIKNTKKLAKKQITWFKADPRIKWISIDNYDNIFYLIKDIIRIILEDISNGKN